MDTGHPTCGGVAGRGGSCWCSHLGEKKKDQSQQSTVQQLQIYGSDQKKRSTNKMISPQRKSISLLALPGCKEASPSHCNIRILSQRMPPQRTRSLAEWRTSFLPGSDCHLRPCSWAVLNCWTSWLWLRPDDKSWINILNSWHFWDFETWTFPSNQLQPSPRILGT